NQQLFGLDDDLYGSAFRHAASRAEDVCPALLGRVEFPRAGANPCAPSSTSSRGASCPPPGFGVLRKSLESSWKIPGARKLQIEREFYDFGPFRLDAQNRILLREDAPVEQLTPKVIETLLALVRRNG